MTTGYRSNIGYAGEPIQQSMEERSADYTHRNDVKMKLGIILTVYPADSTYNSSALLNASGRGYRHECTVQIIEDGIGNYSKIDHVVIPPSVPSGVDNYMEVLPRSSSTSVNTASVFDPNLQLMDPNDLDGDMCVVAFLGGERDYPFIVSWWPHTRNFVDPQTKGPGTLNSNTQGVILDQQNRLFRRINGAELTVTKDGNIYLDTSTAGEPVIFGLPPVKGKIARAPSALGGNFRTVIKPTAHFELDWNVPQDGEGLDQSPDPQIPQSNPANTPQGNQFAPVQKLSTFLKVDAAIFDLMVPTEIKLKSNSIISIEAASTCNILSPDITIGGRGGDVTIDVNTITTNVTDLDQTTSKSTNFDVTEAFSVNATNAIDLVSSNEFFISASASTLIESPSVTIGSPSAALPLITKLTSDFYAEAVPLLIPPATAPNPVTNAASIASIILVLNALKASFEAGLTTETKAS